MDFLKAEIERKKRQMQDSKLVGPGKYQATVFKWPQIGVFSLLWHNFFQIADLHRKASIEMTHQIHFKGFNHAIF